VIVAPGDAVPVAVAGEGEVVAVVPGEGDPPGAADLVTRGVVVRVVVEAAVGLPSAGTLLPSEPHRGANQSAAAAATARAPPPMNSRRRFPPGPPAARVAAGGAVSATAAPQAAQKAMPGSSGAPQRGQMHGPGGGAGVPQDSQKATPSPSGAPQFGQFNVYLARG